MKILEGDSSTIVFLIKKFIKDVDFDDEIKVRDFLKKLVIKLKKYNINLSGYYNGIAHIDDNYGVIIELKREDLEYFEYTDDEIDINLKVRYEEFLYELYDFNFLKIGSFYYKEQDKLYLKVNNISDIDLGRILEYAKIIYGKKALGIIERGHLKEMV